jgi:hypothetical protein
MLKKHPARGSSVCPKLSAAVTNILYSDIPPCSEMCTMHTRTPNNTHTHTHSRDYWRDTFDGGILGGLFEADAIGDLLTLSLGRFLCMFPVIKYDQGKWLMVSALRWFLG